MRILGVHVCAKVRCQEALLLWFAGQMEQKKCKVIVSEVFKVVFSAARMMEN